MVFLFLAAVGLYVLSQNAVMGGTAREAEEVIRRIRARLFETVRQADYLTIDRVGRALLHAALAQETQGLSRTVTLLAIAAQQTVTLVFVSLFLAWLSLPAFAIAIAFGSIAVGFHARRSHATNEIMAQAGTDDQRLFEGLEHLLNGFKEVRVNDLLARDLVSAIAQSSDEARKTKSCAKQRWADDFTLIQVVFYSLTGLMVFVVPLFDTSFAKVAIEAMTVALFMVGPISTIAQAIPAVGETEGALTRLSALERRLERMAETRDAEDTLPLVEPIREIALRGVSFSYRETDGSIGFTVGPLHVSFRTGECVFVTGGNGSGKSTLLRLLIGLLYPDCGTVEVNGKPLQPGQRQAYRDTIATVLSDYHLFRHLYGLGSIDSERAAALLHKFEIENKVSLRDGRFTTVDLSGGQRKRLALMVAELEDKPVLVLDEWAADQDPGFRKKFYEEILPGLRRPDRIIICVTHDERYFATADRVVDMDEGRFRA
ncbi:MAG TPA: cyclic peptide export ABC transporter, partial [Telmatospirillum sp.]|nr:cyclic peptide export ABC transporter [Telmatospirillum sp.]